MPTSTATSTRRIRAAGCDIVINNSTGGGVHGDMVKPLPGNRWEIAWEERIKGMDAGAEMCTLDATTLNLSLRGPRDPDGHAAHRRAANSRPA